MSHYLLAVITKTPDKEDVQAQLKPFVEGLEVETVHSREELIERGRYCIDFIKRTSYAEYLKDKEAFLKNHEDEPSKITFMETEMESLLEATDDQLYDYYANMVFTEEQRLENRGGAVSVERSCYLMDGYEIGGRWDQYLALKSGLKTNTAQIKELDRSVSEEERTSLAREWEVVVEGAPQEEGEDFSSYRKGQYMHDYQTKEEFIRARSGFGSYALLTHAGDWFELGWTYNNETNEEKRTFSEVMETYLDEHPEYYLTVVDYHR